MLLRFIRKTSRTSALILHLPTCLHCTNARTCRRQKEANSRILLWQRSTCSHLVTSDRKPGEPKEIAVNSSRLQPDADKFGGWGCPAGGPASRRPDRSAETDILHPMPRVFLSYSRTDEDFATLLLKRLEAEAPDVSLWQDRTRMEGGVGWWHQVKDALDQVEFMVLLMSQATLRSETVRKEWRYARQQGVCV